VEVEHHEKRQDRREPDSESQEEGDARPELTQWNEPSENGGRGNRDVLEVRSA
jgi:hypothetical protein